VYHGNQTADPLSERRESMELDMATDRVGQGRHQTLVLAEAGDDMWLVKAKFDDRPSVGTRFTFLDSEWEIAWTRPEGCGAVPAGAD
jgi:hypothetical protein